MISEKETLDGEQILISGHLFTERQKDRKVWLMTHQIRNQKIKRVLISTLVALGIGIGNVSFGESNVNAACSGVGSYYSSSSYYGYEASQTGTCDGLNDYYGLFQDKVVDGFRIYVRTRLINGNTAYVNSGLTNSVNTNYYYNYVDNNSSTYYQLCDTSGGCASEGHNWGF